MDNTSPKVTYPSRHLSDGDLDLFREAQGASTGKETTRASRAISDIHMCDDFPLSNSQSKTHFSVHSDLSSNHSKTCLRKFWTQANFLRNSNRLSPTWGKHWIPNILRQSNFQENSPQHNSQQSRTRDFPENSSYVQLTSKPGTKFFRSQDVTLLIHLEVIPDQKKFPDQKKIPSPKKFPFLQKIPNPKKIWSPKKFPGPKKILYEQRKIAKILLMKKKSLGNKYSKSLLKHGLHKILLLSYNI